ncbi:MAG: carboxypeptidase-like regulatory domain-containing protein [Pyrinomonadaceae bacterium]
MSLRLAQITHLIVGGAQSNRPPKEDEMKPLCFLKISCLLILMLSACLWPASVLGQTAATARISGLVTDTNGAAVAGASVNLADKTTKAERIVTTNEEGRYAFANIDPATYDITITVQGFRTAVFSDVKADIAVATIRDATLEAGNVSETVTVSGGREALLQTDDATVGNTIEQDRLERLPNTLRRATSLIIL